MLYFEYISDSSNWFKGFVTHILICWWIFTLNIYEIRFGSKHLEKEILKIINIFYYWFLLSISQLSTQLTNKPELTYYFFLLKKKFQKIRTYLEGASRIPFVVHATSGSGKTTVLAMAASQTKSWLPENTSVIIRWVCIVFLMS